MLQVQATLNYGNLPTTANMVCSAAFDRDGEYFATAGVNRGIKVKRAPPPPPLPYPFFPLASSIS